MSLNGVDGFYLFGKKYNSDSEITTGADEIAKVNEDISKIMSEKSDSQSQLDSKKTEAAQNNEQEQAQVQEISQNLASAQGEYSAAVSTAQAAQETASAASTNAQSLAAAASAAQSAAAAMPDTVPQETGETDEDGNPIIEEVPNEAKIAAQAQADALQATADAAQAQADAAQAAAQEAQAQAQALQETCTQMQEALEQIETQNEENEEQDAELTALQEQIEQYNAQIESLNAELKDLEEKQQQAKEQQEQFEKEESEKENGGLAGFTVDENANRETETTADDLTLIYALKNGEKTEIKHNSDGSTVTTTTMPDGSVVVAETDKDGHTKTTVKKDDAVISENEINSDNSLVTVIPNSDGEFVLTSKDGDFEVVNKDSKGNTRNNIAFNSDKNGLKYSVIDSKTGIVTEKDENGVRYINSETDEEISISQVKEMQNGVVTETDKVEEIEEADETSEADADKKDDETDEKVELAKAQLEYTALTEAVSDAVVIADRSVEFAQGLTEIVSNMSPDDENYQYVVNAAHDAQDAAKAAQEAVKALQEKAEDAKDRYEDYTDNEKVKTQIEAFDKAVEDFEEVEFDELPPADEEEHEIKDRVELGRTDNYVYILNKDGEISFENITTKASNDGDNITYEKRDKYVSFSYNDESKPEIIFANPEDKNHLYTITQQDFNDGTDGYYYEMRQVEKTDGNSDKCLTQYNYTSLDKIFYSVLMDNVNVMDNGNGLEFKDENWESLDIDDILDEIDEFTEDVDNSDDTKEEDNKDTKDEDSVDKKEAYDRANANRDAIVENHENLEVSNGLSNESAIKGIQLDLDKYYDEHHGKYSQIDNDYIEDVVYEMTADLALYYGIIDNIDEEVLDEIKNGTKYDEQLGEMYAKIAEYNRIKIPDEYTEPGDIASYVAVELAKISWDGTLNNDYIDLTDVGGKAANNNDTDSNIYGTAANVADALKDLTPEQIQAIESAMGLEEGAISGIVDSMNDGDYPEVIQSALGILQDVESDKLAEGLRALSEETDIDLEDLANLTKSTADLLSKVNPKGLENLRELIANSDSNKVEDILQNEEITEIIEDELGLDVQQAADFLINTLGIEEIDVDELDKLIDMAKELDMEALVEKLNNVANAVSEVANKEEDETTDTDSEDKVDEEDETDESNETSKTNKEFLEETQAELKALQSVLEALPESDKQARPQLEKQIEEKQAYVDYYKAATELDDLKEQLEDASSPAAVRNIEQQIYEKQEELEEVAKVVAEIQKSNNEKEIQDAKNKANNKTTESEDLAERKNLEEDPDKVFGINKNGDTFEILGFENLTLTDGDASKLENAENGEYILTSKDGEEYKLKIFNSGSDGNVVYKVTQTKEDGKIVYSYIPQTNDYFATEYDIDNMKTNEYYTNYSDSGEVTDWADRTFIEYTDDNNYKYKAVTPNGNFIYSKNDGKKTFFDENGDYEFSSKAEAIKASEVINIYKEAGLITPSQKLLLGNIPSLETVIQEIQAGQHLNDDFSEVKDFKVDSHRFDWTSETTQKAVEQMAVYYDFIMNQGLELNENEKATVELFERYYRYLYGIENNVGESTKNLLENLKKICEKSTCE